MDDIPRTSNLTAHALEVLLKTHFNFLWVITDDGALWEFRFLIKRIKRIRRIERGSGRSTIRLTLIANRNACRDDLQHAAYLELVIDDGALSLAWSGEVNHSLKRALPVFASIYPLDRLVTEICEVLRPRRVEVAIPEIVPPPWP